MGSSPAKCCTWCNIHLLRLMRHVRKIGTLGPFGYMEAQERAAAGGWRYHAMVQCPGRASVANASAVSLSHARTTQFGVGTQTRPCVCFCELVSRYAWHDSIPVFSAADPDEGERGGPISRTSGHLDRLSAKIECAAVGRATDTRCSHGCNLHQYRIM